MLAKGYVAATVDEICSAAGVTKGSFFHYFRSKEELGKVLLERFARKQEGAFAEACAAIEDPLDRIYCMIDCAIESFRNPDMKGCLVGTFAQEISETHPELRAVCQCSFERFAAGMGEAFAAAKALHAPEASFDAASLGTCFLSLAQGSMLLLKTTGERAALAQNLVHFKQYVQSLYGR